MIKKLNPYLIGLLLWWPLMIITVATWICAFGKDEGTLGDGMIRNLLADLFWITRFPTHTILWNWMIEGNMWFYFPGLIINTIFYTVAIVGLMKVIVDRLKN